MISRLRIDSRRPLNGCLTILVRYDSTKRVHVQRTTMKANAC